MERKRLPTAICPNCKDFAFRIYRNIFKRRLHQCCKCQLVFLRKLFIFKIIFDDNYDKGEI